MVQRLQLLDQLQQHAQREDKEMAQVLSSSEIRRLLRGRREMLAYPLLRSVREREESHILVTCADHFLAHGPLSLRFVLLNTITTLQSLHCNFSFTFPLFDFVGYHTPLEGPFSHSILSNIINRQVLPSTEALISQTHQLDRVFTRLSTNRVAI